MYHTVIFSRVLLLLSYLLTDSCSAFSFLPFRGDGVRLSTIPTQNTIVFNALANHNGLVRPSAVGIFGSSTLKSPLSTAVRPPSQKHAKVWLNLFNNNNNDPFRTKNSVLLPTILTTIGLTLFFFSPLGALFFAITNSLFLLALITPLLLVGGFQIWTQLNTIQGTCPSCGAPITVLKEGREFLSSATPCFNCGAFVRATADNKGIELCNPSPASEDLFSSNIFFPTEEDEESLSKKAKRESTVIDVTVIEEEQQEGKRKRF